MTSNTFPFTDFETFGNPKTEAEVLESLRRDSFAYRQFLTLTEPLKQDFIFLKCTHNKITKLDA